MGHQLSFKDKIALITGASRGQGAAEAAAFCRHGATVVIADIRDEEGFKLAKELSSTGGIARYQHLDVSSEHDWIVATEGIDRSFGTLDILVNNAGISVRKGIAATPIDTWRRILEVNLTGVFLGLQSSLELLSRQGGGTVINVSSVAGLQGYGSAAYSTTKWALRGLTRAAAAEFGCINVRVNSIHPGLVDTPMIQESENPELHTKAWLRMTPLGRTGNVSDIANLVLFLASEESSYLNGSEIAIDGGFSSSGAILSLKEFTDEVELLSNIRQDPSRSLNSI
ncbi:MAG: glucose 1-dehydrogenase [Actinobacteria bacterium]|nr:glucose 1-dehydrogenase [Actinomycetota bacterium]